MEHRYLHGLAIMRAIHRALFCGVCVSAFFMMSCRKAAVAPASTPPAPAPIVVPRKEVPKKDVNLPAAPPIASKTTPEAKPPVSENPVLQPPVQPKPRKVRVARRAPEPKPVAPKPVTAPAPGEEPKQVAAAEVKPEAAAAAVQAPPAAAQPAPPEAAATVPPAVAPAPKLGQMLTPEESRGYLKRLDTTVDRVKMAMNAILVKTLSNDQKEIVGRVKSFLAQAEQAREQDLVSAVNLAERADLLSRDLLERLR